ncbi:MAG: non-ribosomal peptide synthetase [Alphaproteobacteria bacterium]|nr:non-ribosomal peptide synthetase [Alphaproteobacteria bacterium]MBP7761921.1 non-ribosomal peptide synthetase [Alphaproteobacteria bacterium]
MKEQMTFYRNVSFSEHLYLNIAKLFPPFCLHMVIEGEGKVKVNTLQDALNHVADKNPGCRLVYQKGKWFDSKKNPPVHILEENDFQNISDLLSLKPMDIKKGPTAEVYVCGQRIIFRASHAVMDAKGIQFWAEETFRVLRKEEPLGTNSTMTDQELLLSLGHENSRISTPFSYAPAGGNAFLNSGFVWSEASFAGGHTSFVAKTAACLMERAHLQGHQALRFMIPVDLRRKLPHIRATANMTSPLIIDVCAGEQWEHIYANIIKALQENQESAMSSLDRIYALLPPFALACIHKVCLKRKKFPFSATISHIGQVDLIPLSCPDFKASSAFFLPLNMPAMPLTIVSTESGGILRVCASSLKSPDRNGDPKRILQDIENALHETPSIPQDWNKTETSYPRNRTVHDLFESQAAKTPDAIAIFEKEQTLTYAELEIRSNALAQELLHHGLKKGDRVAICMSHSLLVPACFLAILKAGGVFVPIDPENPPERIETILKDSEADYIFTEDFSLFSAFERVKKIHPENVTANAQYGLPIPETCAEDIAYIIYTSGSTGKPKGVEVCHRSLVNYLSWAKHHYLDSLDEQSIFGLFTSFAFDLTLTSIFLPLTTGGAIDIFPQGLRLDTIHTMVHDKRVNCLKLTPSHLKILKEAGTEKIPLRRLIVGGENLSTALAKAIYEDCGGRAKIFNEYGPTEATVGCMVHEFNPDRDTNISVPLGVPAANTRIHLLDDEGKPAPYGIAAEIYISGDCLANGYYRAPELNKEKFVRLPETDTIAYRTGDLATWEKDGRLYYLGRIDRQMKIRGYRIELGEVENTIKKIENIKDCVAITAGDGNNSFMAAFYTSTVPLDDDFLKTEASRLFPAYMRPAMFIHVESIPLTINGKADEKLLGSMLPASVGTHSETNNIDEDEIIQKVCAIVCDVLKVPNKTINPDVSFFDLGCDSLNFVILTLQASKILLPEHLHDTFLASANLDKIIKNPTSRQLAMCIKEILGP